jgi:hypothetical protein
MDQIENFHKTQSELEEMIKNKKLDEETKKLVETAIDFGYSAAFCERTSDMNGSFYGSTKYTEKYIEMKKLLKNDR